MAVIYDKHYQTRDLFGEPYPELIDFFSKCRLNGKLLDLGCGQGRDAIALARLGYEVTGIDHSSVGIEQMNEVAKAQGLALEDRVEDVYQFQDFGDFDFILLDSMFHFTKVDLKMETGFIKRIVQQSKTNTVIVFCIQNNGKKVDILNKALDTHGKLKRLDDRDFQYRYKDGGSNHQSITAYKMIAVKKR